MFPRHNKHPTARAAASEAGRGPQRAQQQAAPGGQAGGRCAAVGALPQGHLLQCRLICTTQLRIIQQLRGGERRAGRQCRLGARAGSKQKRRQAAGG